MPTYSTQQVCLSYVPFNSTSLIASRKRGSQNKTSVIKSQSFIVGAQDRLPSWARLEDSFIEYQASGGGGEDLATERRGLREACLLRVGQVPSEISLYGEGCWLVFCCCDKHLRCSMYKKVYLAAHCFRDSVQDQLALWQDNMWWNKKLLIHG